MSFNNVLVKSTSTNKNVYLLLGLLFFSRIGVFISIPYLAFLLIYQHFSPFMIGAIVASQSFSYAFFSVVSGFLADRFGKKKGMMHSLLLTSLMSVGLAHASSALAYLGFNIALGAARSLFDAAMPAYLTDMISAEKQRRMFNLRFLLINAAGAVGPLVGVYFANRHSSIIFSYSAVIYLMSAMAVQIFLPKDQLGNAQQSLQFNATLKVLAADKFLILLAIASTLYWIAYIQLEAPFAQVLMIRDPAHAVWLFGLMWVINTIMIVILQMPISEFTKNLSVFKLVCLGTSLLCIAFLGLAFFSSRTSFVICIIILTFGEIFLSPITNIVIAQLAPPALRGSYFGVISFTFIGMGIGLLVGGALIQYAGAEVLSLTMATLFIVMTACYYYIAKGLEHKMRKETSSIQ